MEAKLREGQAENALVTIRGRLHSKRFLINFRNKNLTGQKKTTRAHTILSQLGNRIEISARKYRDARAALTSLKGVDYAPHLKILKASDLILEGEDARDSSEAAKSDREALKKLAKAGGGKRAQPHRNDASKSKAPGVSWIWLAREGLDVSEEDLHECTYIVCVFSFVNLTKYLYSTPCRLVESEGAQEPMGRRGRAPARGDATCAQVSAVGDRAMGRASRQRWGPLGHHQ
jgi:hypothetical protein